MVFYRNVRLNILGDKHNNIDYYDCNTRTLKELVNRFGKGNIRFSILEFNSDENMYYISAHTNQREIDTFCGTNPYNPYQFPVNRKGSFELDESWKTYPDHF